MEWTQWRIVAAWILFRCLQHVAASALNSDVVALQLLLKGWQNTPLNWTGYDPCGSYWMSVECETAEATETVTKLILNTGTVVGVLAPAIGDLKNLQILDLSSNPGLTGPIPKELGQLQNLKFLSLQGCGFSGSVPPELGLLKQLTFLALNKNKLSGVIPPELGALDKVYWFDLAENQISGPLPVSTSNPLKLGLDTLTGVKHIHLFNNSLTGTLPKEIATLPILIHFLVDNNLLTGTLPVEYGSLAKIEIMRFDNNQLTGPIPVSYAALPTLMEFNARNNSLVGTLPDFSNLTKLTLLSVGLNVFDLQPLPASLINTKLQTLEIDRGNLNGTVPAAVLQIQTIEYLSLASNRLEGAVDLTNISGSLALLNLADNNITFVTGALSGHYNLSLAGNPACSSNLLHFSDDVCLPLSFLSRNDTSRPCSGEASCKNDKETLNPYLCSCAVPLIVYFQFNAPTFSDASEQRLNKLRTVLANSTQLPVEQVWIKDAFFIFSHRLILSAYFFPAKGIHNLEYDAVVTINSKIFLHQLQGVPTEFGPYAVSDNIPGLEVITASGSSALSSGAIAGISIGVIVLVAAIIAVGTYAFAQKKRADKALSMPFTSWSSLGKKSGSAPQLKGARYFSLQELKKATDNFSSNNQIGSGGYGNVYKGKLLSGELAAIKRAEEGSLQGATEFKTEIELLSRVHHRNLVGLLGFCDDQGTQALVYEFMANGSLRDHLGGHSSVLTWRKRLEIAHDSAMGLTYLHELASPPIIHRDVKSSNILLDVKFNAKVADFGLGKLGIAEDKTHISTQVKGTMGYLDPEYYMTQLLTDKSDVYSFGVVLLELLTARLPIVRGKHIVREVRAALDRGVPALLQLVDPFLEEFPEDGVSKLVDLAMQCVEELSTDRPTMSEVARELEALLLDTDESSTSAPPRMPSYVSPSSGGLYAGASLLNASTDPSFAYSGAFPRHIEPK